MNKRSWIIAGAIFSIDFVSKFLAYIFLPPFGKNGIHLFNAIYLCYAPHTDPIAYIAGGNISSRWLFAYCLFMILLIVMKYSINAFKLPVLWRIVLYGLYILLSVFLFKKTQEFSPSLSLSLWESNVIPMTINLILTFTFVYYTKDTIGSIIWAAILGSTLGNLLGFVYPPFSPVNFLRWNNLLLRRTEVINFADIVLDVSYAFGILYLPVYFCRSIITYLKAKDGRSRLIIESKQNNNN